MVYAIPTYELRSTPAMLVNIGNGSSAIRNLRREEVFITPLGIGIGHTRITHSYLLNHEEQPFCIVCYQPFTVKHIVIDCIDFFANPK